MMLHCDYVILGGHHLQHACAAPRALLNPSQQYLVPSRTDLATLSRVETEAMQRHLVQRKVGKRLFLLPLQLGGADAMF